MNLVLSSDQVDELRILMDGALGDLSHEIADTDNWENRKQLRARRERLRALRGRDRPPAGAGEAPGSPAQLSRLDQASDLAESYAECRGVEYGAGLDVGEH